MKGKKVLTWLLSCVCLGALALGVACGGDGNSSDSSTVDSPIESSSRVDSSTIEASSSEVEVSSEEASSEVEVSSEEASSEVEVSSEEASSEVEVSSEEASFEVEVSSEEESSEVEVSSEEVNSEVEVSSEEASSEVEISSEEYSSDIESSHSEPEVSEHICSFGDWYETTAATCETVGEERRDCACGEFETRVVDILQHPWGEWNILKEADCNNWGEQIRYCQGCDDFEKEIIPALEHDVENGICKNCGVDVSGEGISFVLNEDGESYCASNWTSNNIYLPFCIIPSTYKGLPVTRIGEHFFTLGGMVEDEYELYHVVAMEIPSSIISIDMWSGHTVKLIEVYDRSGLMYQKQAALGIVNIYTPNEGQSILNIDENGYITYQREEEFWLAGCMQSKETVVIPDGVTIIGPYAFGRCYDIKQVYIPDGVKRIEYSAFYYCKNLLSISIPDSVTTIGNSAFNQCHSLISVGLGSGLESVQKNSFKYCVRLTEVYYISLSEWHFWHWDSEELSSTLYKYATPTPSKLSIDTEGWIYCVDGVEKILVGYVGEDENWEIPNDITSIGNGAFYNNNDLTEIVIPEGVTSIGKNAFAYCRNLSEVKISESVTSIGGNAFAYCDNLEKITIPNGVTELGDYIFSGSSLVIYCEAVDKPNGWAEKWSYYSEYFSCPVVWDCLNNEVADNGYIYITMDNFCYTIINGEAYLTKCLLNVANVNIPSEIIYKGSSYSVTGIWESAFSNCENLVKVNIPNSVTSIGSDAFYNCSSLTEILIPSTVEYIGRDAFYGCNALTICCETSSRPNDWNSSWNQVLYKKYCPVVWDCQNNDMTWDGYRYVIIDGIRYSLRGYGVMGVDIAFDPGEEDWAERNEARVVGQPSNITIANIPAEVTYNGVTYIVTTIDEYAFYGCDNLIEVVIPASVTHLGAHAFYNSSLTTITLPDSITWIGDNVFSGCKNLTSITLGRDLSWIDRYAFSGCESLTEIVIPQSVNTINEGAFGDCTNLLVIYCEAISKPNSWKDDWNTSAPVVWGYTGA